MTTDSEGNSSYREVAVNSVDDYYIKAFCLSRQAARTFRIDRIDGFITMRETGEGYLFLIGFICIVEKRALERIDRMPTNSFNKQFVIHEHADAEWLIELLQRNNPIQITQRDPKADSEKGIAALKRKLNSFLKS